MPFLKNVWYVAAHAHELDEGLVARTICNEQLVMFRMESGDIAVLEDRCPHRFVPLSMGRRVGDALQCGYHGLQFGRDGSCVSAPNDDEAQRARMCVRSFTSVERDSIIWLWMGEKEQADPSLIPEFNFFVDPAFAPARGYSYIKGNYQLIADNLLDLSHIHFLHPHIHAGSDFADFTNKMKIEGDTVWSMLWRHHYHLDAGRQQMWGIATDDVEGQGHARWDAPGVLQVFTAFWEHGKTIDEGFQTPNAHLLTPETEYTTHYFWGSGRNYMLDNEALTKGTVAAMGTVFETQDGPMIEAQQRAMGTSDKFLDMKPAILRADTAGLAARRILKRRLDAEARDAVAQPETAAAE
jgi:phenylpropionate dioxygenase-like ring-hydroxylating dioxygenase large terminal subunit